MMRRTVVILSLVLVGLLSFAFPHVARAVELDPGCTVYDFTVDDYDWQDVGIAPRDGATYVTSTGWRKAAGKIGIVIELAVTLPENHHISYLRWTIHRSGNSAGLEAAAGRLRYLDSNVYDTYRTDYPVNGTVNREYDNLNVAPVDELRFIADGTSSSTVTLLYFEVCVTEDSGLYGRPFRSADEDTEWDFWEYNFSSLTTPQNIYDHTVVATSNDNDAFVHSAFAGTVTVVEKLTAARCSDVLSDTPVLNAFFVCQIWAPASITGETTESLYGIEGFGRDFSAHAVLSAWRVEIESAADPTIRLEYFARDADLFIEVGSQIQEGCVLGKTLRLTGIALNLRGLFAGTDVVFPESSKGITVMNLFDGEGNAELLPNFKTTYPTSNGPCNTPPEYANCQGGTLLDRPQDWRASDGASVDNPGATLGRYSSIDYLKPLNGDPNRHPQVRVNARAEGQVASLSVTYGQTSQNFTVSTLDYQDYTIEGDDHQPDLAGLYNLQLANNSDFTISIRYICISFTLDESLDPVPPPPPPTCYFQNPSFVNGTSGWTTTGGVSSGTGEIHVPSGGTFSQVVTLYPDGEDPQTYTIRVRGGIRYYVTYTPDETEATETLDLDYDFPNDAPDEDLGSATFGQLAQANNDYTFSTTFVISTETTGEFIFYPALISAPGDVVGMAVRDVCLFAGEGDPGDEPFPGHDDPGEPQPGPFNESCDIISPPQGDSIGHWISWHWANLNRFFTCDLMVFLNTQYRMLQNHFRTVLWVARWFMASAHMGVDWMGSQFLPWLAGYFSNILPGTVIIAEEGGGQQCEAWDIVCHISNVFNNAIGLVQDFFDEFGDSLNYAIVEIIDLLTETMPVIVNTISEVALIVFNFLADNITNIINTILHVINQVVDFLYVNLTAIINTILDVANRIIDLILFIVTELLGAFIRIVVGIIFLLINGALTLMMTAREAILELLFAWNNATPTPLPGFVDCSENPGNNAWCWVLWLSENTLFSGTLGELIIPLMTAEMWILLVIAFAKEMRRLVFKVASLI